MPGEPLSAHQQFLVSVHTEDGPVASRHQGVPTVGRTAPSRCREKPGCGRGVESQIIACMEACIFCEIVAGRAEASVVYDDDSVVAPYWITNLPRSAMCW